MRDKRTQEAGTFWQRISMTIKRIEWRYDTPISGTISGQLDGEESAELLRLLEDAARQAIATSDEQPVSWKQAELRVQPPGSTD